MIDKEIMKLAREIFNDQVKTTEAMFETLENLTISDDLLSRFSNKQLAKCIVSAILFEVNWQFKPMLPQDLKKLTFDVMLREF